MNTNRLCIIEGNLVKDPEGKTLESGRNLAVFTLAVNHYDQNKSEKVSYFDVEAWGLEADFVMQNLIKGNLVAVVGTLRQERWEKDGKMQSKIKIKASSIAPRHIEKKTD